MSDNSMLATATAAVVGVTAGYVLASSSFECKAKKSSRPAGSSSEKSEGARKYLIGGNWKCNGTLESAKELVKTLNECGPIPSNTEVVVGVPFVHIPMVLGTIRDDIEVAAQNCGVNEKPGAYTGEICASQLVDMGVTWVILGHSERREGFEMAGESSDLVAKKVKIAVDAGLKVQFCIGEKKEERESGITMKVCAEQLEAAKKVLKEEDWAKVSIAYEPVWAIGTGLTATPEMAEETHKEIREWMAKNVSPAVASAIRIQYGGSMKGSNAQGLLAKPNIDGGLIGGASLKADFFNVVNGVP